MDEIRLERDASGIATLTLDRPRRKNAVPPSGWEELRRLFHEVSQSATDRVLVVTGAALDAEAAAQSVNLASEDVREGFAAFLQKRSPSFRGR